MGTPVRRLDPGLTLHNGNWVATLAAAGTTQGDAAAVTAYHCYVTTVAAGSGVVLLQRAPGSEYSLCNAGANALLVYPWSGASLNGVTANLPISIPVNGAAWFKVISSTKLICVS